MPTRQWDRYDAQSQHPDEIRALPRSQPITRLPDTGSLPMTGVIGAAGFRSGSPRAARASCGYRPVLPYCCGRPSRWD
jgi:hypothetical protein